MRHGDIVHACIALLEAAGVEVKPVGGLAYCCGTTKDENLRAAEGMARRTVEKFNAQGADTVVTWCPSCYRHMDQFMGEYTNANFQISHFATMLHRHRDTLAPKLRRPVSRRVMLHQHFGFREVDVNPLVRDLLRLVPGLELVETALSSPGHMCSALAAVPAALQDATRELCNEARALRVDQVVTVFHSCQRLMCALESSEPFGVANYATVLAESLGLELTDEYKQWKTARSADEAVAMVGPGRVARAGEKFFREAIVPELMRPPQKGCDRA